MASIRVRPRKGKSSLFSVLWRDPATRKQASMGFQSAHEAENFKRLIEANGGLREPALKILDATKKERPPVRAMLEEHIAGLPSITARSRADYRRDANLHINPHIGAYSAEDISAAMIKDWLKTLAKTDMADKTIANVHGLLSAAFTTAIVAGLRQDNPCRGIRLPRRNEHERVEMIFLTQSEWRTLDTEIGKRSGGHYQPLFRFLAATGCRWGEAAALKVSDLSLGITPPSVRISRATRRDENSKSYIGPTKTKRSRRTISLPGDFAEQLAEHVKGKAPGDLVFTSTTGNPIHHSNIRSRVWLPAITGAQDRELYKTSALTDVPRIHDLRHSHASWLLAAGLDLLTVQRRLGHESITTSADRYGHLMPAQQLAAAKVLDGVVA